MQDWIEYAIQAGLVALGAVLTLFGKMFKDKWNQIDKSTTSDVVSEKEIQTIKDDINELKQAMIKHMSDEEEEWSQIQQQIIEIYKLLIKSKH